MLPFLYELKNTQCNINGIYRNCGKQILKVLDNIVDAFIIKLA